jgi:RNA polymerase sigma factor (sigma-70 family)
MADIVTDWVASGQALPYADETAREIAREAFAGLLDRYERSLFGFLIVLLGDRDGAKDCLQDTFLRAYEHLQRGKSINAQWLYKVARNRAIDEMRHKQRIRVDPHPMDEAILDESHASEGTLAVHRTLLQLSSDDREILYLAEVDGFTSLEIAAMLGIRAGAVRMRLSRAHVRFRQAYGERR